MNPRNDQALLDAQAQDDGGDCLAHVNAWHDAAGAYADHHWKRDGIPQHNWERTDDHWYRATNAAGKTIYKEKQ